MLPAIQMSVGVCYIGVWEGGESAFSCWIEWITEDGSYRVWLSVRVRKSNGILGFILIRFLNGCN